MLHADCHPDNYWFAKSSLDAALEICVACESDETVEAGPDDLADLAKVKNTVSVMLRDRLFQYTEYWEKEGRSPPPSKEEWYELMDAREPGEDEEYLEVVVDEDGDEVAGPVTAWPFKTGKPGKPPSRLSTWKFRSLTQYLHSHIRNAQGEDLASRFRIDIRGTEAVGARDRAPGRRGV
jgi:hypothetical protein